MTNASTAEFDTRLRPNMWWLVLSFLSFLIPTLTAFLLDVYLGASLMPNFEFPWGPVQLLRNSHLDISVAEGLGFLIYCVGTGVVGWIAASLVRACRLPPLAALLAWFILMPLLSWALGVAAVDPKPSQYRMNMGHLIAPELSD